MLRFCICQVVQNFKDHSSFVLETTPGMYSFCLHLCIQSLSDVSVSVMNNSDVKVLDSRYMNTIVIME